MKSLFDYFHSIDQIWVVMIVSFGALAIGLLYSFILSRRLQSTKSLFVTLAIIPFVVSLVISLLGVFLADTDSITARIVTIAVALGLIRFRSFNGKAEEMLLLFGGVALGFVAGLGYLAFSGIAMATISSCYLILSRFDLFSNQRLSKEKLLKIVVPEDWENEEAFKVIFDKYLSLHEALGMKTINMGSMFRLTYRIKMFDPNDTKEFINELRQKNGNLEISILPFTSNDKSL